MSDASQKLFDTCKKQGKLLEKQSETVAIRMEKEVEKQFQKQNTVKYLTKDMDVKTLVELAKRLTQKPGRLLILVNTTGEKANIIVASSSKQNAGEICKKICLKQGGGGGGNQTMAMGGGNAKDIEKTLEEL